MMGGRDTAPKAARSGDEGRRAEQRRNERRGRTKSDFAQRSPLRDDFEQVKLMVVKTRGLGRNRRAILLTRESENARETGCPPVRLSKRPRSCYPAACRAQLRRSLRRPSTEYDSVSAQRSREATIREPCLLGRGSATAAVLRALLASHCTCCCSTLSRRNVRRHRPRRTDATGGRSTLAMRCKLKPGHDPTIVRTTPSRIRRY